jgi:myo-inositol 2-dehydrogenase/D-chiro-inositol 1-dehydrogenase
MPDSGLSRRDVLQRGALLAGAGLLASSPSAAAAKRHPLTPTPEFAPVQPVGQDRDLVLGCIGVGGRGTLLMHCVLGAPGTQIAAVCELKPHRLKAALDLVEKHRGNKPDAYTGDPYAYRKLLERDDLDGVVVATPCDLHAPMYLDCVKYKKNFYGEKPAAITRRMADRLVAEVPKAGVVAQIGFQRRCSPRYQDGIRRIHNGEIGEIIDARAAWDNDGGPPRGWLGHRARSGDWMLEQACHTWDVLNWVAGSLPTRAFGLGRKDIYVDPEIEPDRDVTDFYVATIEWPGMQVRYSHTWGTPRIRETYEPFFGVYERILGTKGGADLPTGTVYFRGKDAKPLKLHPDEGDQSTLSIRSFLDAVRKGAVPQSTVANGRDATLVGLLVRKAVDEERVVEMGEILGARS